MSAHNEQSLCEAPDADGQGTAASTVGTAMAADRPAMPLTSRANVRRHTPRREDENRRSSLPKHPPHADDGRKDETLVHTEQLLCEAGGEAAADTVGHHSGADRPAPAVTSRAMVRHHTPSLPDDPHSQTGTTWLDALLPAYRRLRRMADMKPDPEATTLDEESQAD